MIFCLDFDDNDNREAFTETARLGCFCGEDEGDELIVVVLEFSEDFDLRVEKSFSSSFSSTRCLGGV